MRHLERLEAVEVDAEHDIPSLVLATELGRHQRRATASGHDEVPPCLTVIDVADGLVRTSSGRLQDLREAHETAGPRVLQQLLQTVAHTEIEEELHSTPLTHENKKMAKQGEKN